MFRLERKWGGPPGEAVEPTRAVEGNFNGNRHLLGAGIKCRLGAHSRDADLSIFGNCDSGDLDAGGALGAGVAWRGRSVL